MMHRLDRVEHLERFADDFRPDAVAGDDRESVRHDLSPPQLRAHHVAATPRPQVMQYFQWISSSVPQAGQRCTMRFCPQLGQKSTFRPSGSVPPQ